MVATPREYSDAFVTPAQPCGFAGVRRVPSSTAPNAWDPGPVNIAVLMNGTGGLALKDWPARRRFSLVIDWLHSLSIVALVLVVCAATGLLHAVCFHIAHRALCC